MANRNLIGSKRTSRVGGCVLIVGVLTAISQAVSVTVADAQVVDIPGVGSLDIPADAVPAGLLGTVPAGLLGTVPVGPIVPLPIGEVAPEVSPAAWSRTGETSIVPLAHGSSVLAAAETKIGAPYVWGATGPDSFDCSGLAQWAYAQAGVSIPRTTYQQVDGGSPVAEGDLQPGDLVLYYGGDHVGLYAGNGEVIHAPTSGQTVKRAPVDSMPFYAARRY